MSAYRNNFNETRHVSFFINYDQILERYKKIWEKVKNITKKEFDGKPVYNEKYLKAKIKEKSIQISTIRKKQNKVLNLFFDQ